MATRHTKPTAAEYASPSDSDLRNLIEEKLSEAHATLDLLYCALVDTDSAGAYLETLNPETLSQAVSTVMHRITEAREALEKTWPVRHEVTDQVGGEARQ